MTNRATVALTRCEGYDPARVEEAVRHTVTLLGGMSEFVHEGQRVLLRLKCVHGSQALYSVILLPRTLPSLGGGAETPLDWKAPVR